MNKVYVEGGCHLVSQLFQNHGFQTTGDFEQANLICFTGGADVSPHLYKDFKHPYTYSDPYRDAREQRLFNEAFARNIPMVGICRGGQLLNVLSGGRMYQHVTGHGGSHNIIDEATGETILVTSTHHQMIMPSENGQLIAFALNGGTREWMEGEVIKLEKSDKDNEVVWYHETRSLCFQPHPEYNQGSEEYGRMRSYFFQLIDNLIFN